jgi:hypothetical protein
MTINKIVLFTISSSEILNKPYSDNPEKSIPNRIYDNELQGKTREESTKVREKNQKPLEYC